MRKVLRIFLFAMLTMAFANGRSKPYPLSDFRLPVDHTPYLSGTFGELRPNHFHSGIDIKSSRGKVGDIVRAAADGWVSRIKVQASGYGKALYIDHPNGYTTVYAHLHKFPAEVERYVKEQQVAQESFSVDIQPEPGRFSFAQGDKVGTMGNTGRSFGPHLHFEIRNTVTEEPINPLLFGIKVRDNIAPKLHQIKVYPLNESNEATEPFVKNIGKGKSGRYYVGGDTLVVKAWRMGIGLKAYDHLNGASNWNGVYAIDTYVDERLVHRTEFEKFSFDNTRYINAHTDYREKLRNKAWFNRCYRMPGNDLPLYPVLENDGVIPLYEKSQKIRLVAHDVNGNASEVVFWAKRDKEWQPTVSPPYDYMLPYNEDSYIERNDLYLHFPKGVLYENLYMSYGHMPDHSSDAYSDTHHLGDKETPMHKWYKIGIRPKNLPQGKRDKALVALCQNGKKPVSHGGVWEGDWLMAEARVLGDFCVMVDDIPPTIKPSIFKTNLKGYSKIQFQLSDNFKTSKKLDDYTWNGYVDGKWILFTPNPNKTVITHRFDKNLAAGEHTFRLEVADERGNMAVFERNFIR